MLAGPSQVGYLLSDALRNIRRPTVRFNITFGSKGAALAAHATTMSDIVIDADVFCTRLSILYTHWEVRSVRMTNQLAHHASYKRLLGEQGHLMGQRQRVCPDDGQAQRGPVLSKDFLAAHLAPRL